YLVSVFVMLLMIWSVLSFLSLGYDGGTDRSDFGRSCYKMASIINFSSIFWQKFFPSFIVVVVSIFITSILVASLILLVKIVIPDTLNKKNDAFGGHNDISYGGDVYFWELK
ncbi:MAG TPA: hypothetical protein PKI08_06030, partial [Aquaticitalea sp.]|nr:hypothetical protein [Aquaticitalea sp.]